MAKNKIKLFLLFIILIFTIVFSIYIGSVYLTKDELILGLFNKESLSGQILRVVRFPRLTASIFAGIALSLSGFIIQSVFANPLASPSVIGINSGAGFFTALSMVIIPNNLFALPLSAFLGALFTIVFVFSIAKLTGASKLTLILSGIAVNSLMNAGISTLTNWFPDIIIGMRDFQIGGFSGVTYNTLFPAIIIISIGASLLILFSKELEILDLGEEIALSLGLKVPFWRMFFLVLASMLCSAAVSYSGLIGFVGLIVPHCVRLIFPDAGKRTQSIASILLGSSFLSLCDTVSRSLFSPYELPVGIMIAFLGAPFFLWLIFYERKRKHD